MLKESRGNCKSARCLRAVLFVKRIEQPPERNRQLERIMDLSLPEYQLGAIDSEGRRWIYDSAFFRKGNIYNNFIHGKVAHSPSHGPGSLREGCHKKEPLWIAFEVSGTIHLRSYLSQRINLTGKGLRLKECEHIIVCNLGFEGGRGHDVDGIQIKPNSKHIWIDRCSLRDYDDGLLDITLQTTDITISQCYFARQDKTMLIGADPTHIGDTCIRVTIHHCFFDGTQQRQPRVRFGKVHLYNNYTRNWRIYAVCASVESQIYSQCNIYEAGQKKKTFEYYTENFASLSSEINEDIVATKILLNGLTDKEEAKTGLLRSEGDVFLNGAQSHILRSSGTDCMFHLREFYQTWTMEQPSDSLKCILQVCTGWQSIPLPADKM
ncbi:Pectate lyase, partial [Dillenia turbinata]